MPGNRSFFLEPIEYCQICQERAQLNGGNPSCPGRQLRPQSPDDINALRDITPHGYWITPDDAAEHFHFSAKHVIRLISDRGNQIAATNIRGRWHVLRCSFDQFLRDRDENDLP